MADKSIAVDNLQKNRLDNKIYSELPVDFETAIELSDLLLTGDYKYFELRYWQICLANLDLIELKMIRHKLTTLYKNNLDNENNVIDIDLERRLYYMELRLLKEMFKSIPHLFLHKLTDTGIELIDRNICELCHLPQNDIVHIKKARINGLMV